MFCFKQIFDVFVFLSLAESEPETCWCWCFHVRSSKIRAVSRHHTSKFWVYSSWLHSVSASDGANGKLSSSLIFPLQLRTPLALSYLILWCKCAFIFVTTLTDTCGDLLLVTLKCDLAMVCLTTFGVTVLIFHFNSRLCSAGSSSTAGQTTQHFYVIYNHTFPEHLLCLHRLQA